ncbi:hypothetical protein EJB05_50076 [Eragrostis curvula]|uniref:Uncharacterized protein n=1 Tax=Eragrostis curvula TaxID=38414 RepID=A0A5J9SZA4_9POAL|nr:hypothetical protein EJB05_50076 [Eragrostis curvula]
MKALENEPDAAVDPEKDDAGKQEAAAERPFFVSPFREKVVTPELFVAAVLDNTPHTALIYQNQAVFVTIRLLHDDDSTNVYRQFGDVDP